MSPLLGETLYWRIVLDHNQNLLGKTMLVLRPHVEQVAALSQEQWFDLHEQMEHLTRALETPFRCGRGCEENYHER